MNDKQILSAIDKAVLRLCVVGQNAGRAQKEVLKAIRKGLLTLPQSTMELTISAHCEKLVNHEEESVRLMYTLLQRSIRNAAKDASYSVTFSKKNNEDKTAKVVSVSLTKVEPKVEPSKDQLKVEEIPAQANPKPVASGKDQSGATPADHNQSVDNTPMEDKASVRSLGAALDIVMDSDAVQMSPDELYQLVEKFYGQWSVEGRQGFVQRVIGLVERTEKKDKKVA